MVEARDSHDPTIDFFEYDDEEEEEAEDVTVYPVAEVILDTEEDDKEVAVGEDKIDGGEEQGGNSIENFWL